MGRQIKVCGRVTVGGRVKVGRQVKVCGRVTVGGRVKGGRRVKVCRCVKVGWRVKAGQRVKAGGSVLKAQVSKVRVDGWPLCNQSIEY